MRKLCPAKLEGRDKGNLIAIITTDIELLEVFYAHTISPIAIAALTSLFMVFFMGKYHWMAAVFASIVITTDIELLEVFYAHTISPIAIAALTSLFMVFFMGKYHWMAAVFASIAYLIVGVAIPLWNGKRGSRKGMEFRTDFGELNSFVLDSLRGLDETIQYGQGEKRKQQMSERSESLAKMQESLSILEN